MQSLAISGQLAATLHEQESVAMVSDIETDDAIDEHRENEKVNGYAVWKLVTKYDGLKLFTEQKQDL